MANEGQPYRIALANLEHPARAEDSVRTVLRAIAEAGSAGAQIICFPECFVPGYRGLGHEIAPVDAAFLDDAHRAIAQAAGRAQIAAVVGTERLAGESLPRATALVADASGSILGYQDKVQLDPSEDGTYAPGVERQLFQAGRLTFGVAICHEGWRYPETVRWAARRGAQVVFHPHYHPADPGSGYSPSTFGEQRNTFHEKAALCRAAENNCFFATVNFACQGSPTTSAVVRPDGTLLTYQPYGQPGLLLADLDLSEATGLLASRLRTEANRA